MLQAERVALNFVQRMSGIATLTARFVAEIAGDEARVSWTRGRRRPGCGCWSDMRCGAAVGTITGFRFPMP